MRDGLVEAIRQQQSVWQTRERIVCRDVLQLRVRLLELLVMASGLRLQVRVVHQQDRRDRQQRKRKDTHCRCEPDAVHADRAGAERVAAEAGRGHARVMHAADGESHDERRTCPGNRHLPGAPRP